MGHKRTTTQLAPCNIILYYRFDRNKCNAKSMTDHRANVENMDSINTDKLFEAMEVEFLGYNGPKVVQQKSTI